MKKPITIRWLDIYSQDDISIDKIETSKDLKEFCVEVEDYGVVLKEDKDVLILARAIAHDNKADIIAIPKGCIIESIRLEDIKTSKIKYTHHKK